MVTKPPIAEYDSFIARRERMEAIRETARHIGHEYNNLFGIIISAMGVLKEELAGKEAYVGLKPFIEDAESAAREGAELMAVLLACSGNQGFATGAVEPAELFDAIVGQLRRDIRKDIALNVELMPEPPAVLANLERLEDSIRALLDNAFDAMPNGGTLRISSEVRGPEDTGIADLSSHPNRFLAFSVSDSGEGIDAGSLKRVTDPFFTTRKPNKRGLGLSLAYGYALQTGGHLTIVRNPGGGTTATLLLPATENDDPVSAGAGRGD